MPHWLSPLPPFRPAGRGNASTRTRLAVIDAEEINGLLTFRSLAPRRAAAGLALGLMAGPLAGPVLAEPGDYTAPDLPKRELGGNDSKPGFFDMGKHASDRNDQPTPAPGKAAGTTSPSGPDATTPKP